MSTSEHIDEYGFLSPPCPVPEPDFLQTGNARLEKWVAMLQQWQHYKNTRVLKKRIRKGIPSCIRGRVWYKLANVEALRELYAADHYAILLNRHAQPDDLKVIEADLTRTFPGNIFTQSAEGAARLSRVLNAYSKFDPSIGYVQGMSYIAAMLLLLLSEEEAFWTLCAVQYTYRMRLCFLDGLPGVRSSFYISNGLMRHHFPKVFAQLQLTEVIPSMYATQWFVTGFAWNFPIHSTLRIWDCFLNEGDKVFYRVYLGIIKLNYKLLKHAEFDSAIQTFTKASTLDIDQLLTAAFSFRLSRRTIDRLHQDYLTAPKKKYVNWDAV